MFFVLGYICLYEGVFSFLSGVGLGERLLKEVCCWLHSCDTGLTGSKGCAFIPDQKKKKKSSEHKLFV